jgi:hypothetical protein
MRTFEGGPSSLDIFSCRIHQFAPGESRDFAMAALMVYSKWQMDHWLVLGQGGSAMGLT